MSGAYWQTDPKCAGHDACSFDVQHFAAAIAAAMNCTGWRLTIADGNQNQSVASDIASDGRMETVDNYLDEQYVTSALPSTAAYQLSWVTFAVGGVAVGDDGGGYAVAVGICCMLCGLSVHR